jgi:hypothetical protein
VERTALISIIFIGFAALGGSACVHRSGAICHEAFGYELMEDGTLIYRAVIAAPNGPNLEPYHAFPRTDPAYQQQLERARAASPTFDQDRRAGGSRWYPCSTP